jgi:capsular exopolysaccharide synthesis family protein
MKQKREMDLSAFLQILKERRWLILGVALAAAVLTFALSSLQPDRYKASADLLFRETDPIPTVNPDEPQPEQSATPERIAATNLALSSLDTVTVRVRRRLNTPFSIDELRDRVELSPEGQADIVRITATGNTPAGAARMANVFADEVVLLRRENSQERVQRVIDAIDSQLSDPELPPDVAARLENRSNELEVAKRLRTGDVEIAEQATPPLDRSSPKPVRNAIVGGVLGALLAVLLALLLNRLDRRVRDEDEIAELVGAPILTRVPQAGRTDWERQLFFESFQFLRANIQLRAEERDRRVIAITSVLPGQGKSTVTVRVAEALAQVGAQVTVVDCDLRRPTLNQYFQVSVGGGVTSVLTGMRKATDLLQDTASPGVSLLQAGPMIPVSASILTQTNSLEQMLADVTRVSDYVIVDTAPVTIGADTLAVAAQADGTILVVEAGTIRTEAIVRAVELLHSANVHIMGVVINRAEPVLKGQEYQGYYHSGTGAGLSQLNGGGDAGGVAPPGESTPWPPVPRSAARK